MKLDKNTRRLLAESSLEVRKQLLQLCWDTTDIRRALALSGCTQSEFDAFEEHYHKLHEALKALGEFTDYMLPPVQGGK